MLDLNVTSNAYIKGWMVGRGANASRIAVCHTNIDTQLWFPRPDERGPVRQMLDLPETMTLITFVGRLAPEKRPYMLAQIARGLLDSGRDRFMVLVIGDGPERIKLDQTIDSLNVGSHVRVLGGLQEDALRQTMAASDMFCLPSLKEGISVAIYEAMAMGVVPIGALVGGQAELVTPECGVLIAHGDDELSTYIESIGRLIDDAAACQHMGIAARKRVVEHFRIDLIGERMNALIDQAHAQSRSDPRPVLPKRLGREIATQAIELLRVEGALDSLWNERERLRQVATRQNTKTPLMSNSALFRRLLNRVKRIIEPWRGR
jgi:glycosyltransferase involved in cell wall biosynthesis